jgi:carbamate kinase
MPMDVCVAETQGSIGYMIEQQLRNVLKKEGIEKNIITLVTQVLVDQNDKAFDQPTKPVGPYYSDSDAEELIETRGWKFKEDPRGRGWRRVVASPRPIEVNNWEIVNKLAREGNIVVAAGGGGIPVYFKEDGSLMGIDAVIDKDLASSHLAVKVEADEFYILTDVPKVENIKKHLDDGQFTEGSMAPKVRASIYFVENGKGEAVITEAGQLKGDMAGTIIHK